MKNKDFNKIFNRRVLKIYLFFIFFTFLIVYKLIEVHIIKHDFYEKKFCEQSIGKIIIPAYRGRIIDRNGIILAYSLPAYSIAIRPTIVEIDKLSELYGILSKYNIKADFLSSEKKFKDFIIQLREEKVPFYFISRKFSNKADDLYVLNKFKGVEIIREPTGKRYYNFESLKNIIGMVDIDEKGIEGLELYLDQNNNQIKGEDGYYEVVFDALGNPNYNRVISFKPPVDGKDIILSIDAVLQENLQILAKNKLEEHGATEVTIVVCNKNGEILACVGVDKDENDFIMGGINRLYEPGSIFKIFTIVTALEVGVSPQEKFFSGPSIVVDGWTISNADDGLYTSGYENMEDILTYSFNVGTVSLMLKVGKKNFIDYLYKLGFYEYSGIEHPSDVKPYIGDLKEEPNIRFATISFGQGIAISPLHILRLMTIIANGGYRVPLTFMKDKNRLEEKVLKDFTVSEIRKYLRSVVERGTGKRAEVPGYYPGGKTGTAQIPDPKGGYASGKYVASFVGFFPYFDPQYVIVVSVREPKGMYYGGLVAAPIFKDVASIIISKYNLKPYNLKPLTKSIDKSKG